MRARIVPGARRTKHSASSGTHQALNFTLRSSVPSPPLCPSSPLSFRKNRWRRRALPSRRYAAALALALCRTAPAFAQVAPVSIDSAVSINRFVGQQAANQPDIVVDLTATARLGKGWIGYARPWFRRASTNPHAISREIYQAAVQYQKSGPIATRVDLGYILLRIGLYMK